MSTLIQSLATRVDPDREASVRRLYEDHPYPPPEQDLDAYRELRRTVDSSPRFYHEMFWPAAPRRDDLRILVAGCGTSQAAKLAIQQPGAHVTAIDVSTSSLQCTRDLCDRYELGNVDLRELPVERVNELEGSYDLVVCTGVLHHLEDPEVVLRALREALTPDGAMFLMVYGQYGRAGVYMLQEYCRRLGIEPSVTDANELLEIVRALSDDHPVRVFGAVCNDLTNPTGIADALLHPRDRAYSVPDLFHWLRACGVDHMRWFLQAPYLPSCGWPMLTPHARRLAVLPLEQQYTAMELLRGTMVSHAFVACRSDRDTASRVVDLDDDATWRAWIPMFFNGCRVEQEGLPPEIAGVLRNTAHTYDDLIIPLTLEQAMLYNAMDGQRTIPEIAAASGIDGDPAQIEAFARDFFRVLYWNDQVLLRRSGS